MKHTIQTALTAAVFAASLGISSAGSTASALTAFSPESQQTAAVLYGPAPIKSDLDYNRMLDARDLTLLKRLLMTDNYPETDYPVFVRHLDATNEDYSFNADSNADNKILPSDVRMLRNELTGSTEPTSFHVTILPVPYLSSNQPESAEERQALREKAEALTEREYCAYSFFAGYYESMKMMHNAGEADLPQYGMITRLTLDEPLEFELDYSRAIDDDYPQKTCYATVFLQYLSEGTEFPVSIGNSVRMPKEQHENDIRFDFSYCTYKGWEDGSCRLFDKMLVEYDILTGETEVLQFLSPDQNITLPDSGSGQQHDEPDTAPEQTD